MTRITSILATLALLAGSLFGQSYPSAAPGNESRGLGLFYAPNYAYGYGTIPQLKVDGGTTATGSASITVSIGFVSLSDGRQFSPFSVTAPITIGLGTNQETVTPTAVSGCYPVNVSGSTCTVTAPFANLHGHGDPISSGTFGLQEAINDAFQSGGGQVAVDSYWSANGGTNAMLTAAVGYSSVGIVDTRANATQYWNLVSTQAIGSYLATPTTLASTTAFSSTTVTGSASYTGGTIHVCIAYVDIMGNEGPCSGDYSFADTSAKAIQFTLPAASTGAVGWVPYIGVESGSAKQEYSVLLVTQPTVIGVAPAPNGVCTLTTIETILPACALTNTTYNQTGSAAIVAAYPVVTSEQSFQLGGVSSTSFYAPNSNAHNAYSYEPGAHPGAQGVVTNSPPFTVSATLASTVPFVLGSVQLPAGFMNYQGRHIQVCGFITDAATAVDTVTAVQFWWDADGSNVTSGIPVLLANDQITATLTAAVNREFCQDFTTTVPAATATGGTIQAPFGWIAEGQIAAGTIHFMEPNITIAAVGSLNLAESARIDVVFVETTSTVDTPKLQNLTVTVLN